MVQNNIDTDGKQRRVELTCYSCTETWVAELQARERIGKYGHIGNGFLHDANVVCTNTRGYGTYAPEICPVCGLGGPHDFRSLHVDSTKSDD